MREYEIWIEGYAATGESGTAHLIGKSYGNTFEEACKNFIYPLNTKDYFGKPADWAGEPLELDQNRKYPSIWACRLYDNEKDARKCFG